MTGEKTTSKKSKGKPTEAQSEENNLELPKSITAKKTENFSKWYNQVLAVSKIIDKRYNVKGSFVWLNYGYEIMMNIKKLWDGLFKKNNYKEMYFPLLVPLEYASINTKWWNSFKSEAFYVKGINEEKPKYILRPTGEPAIYPMFSLWIRSYRDLPIRIYETVSSFRYETKHTRPLIRDREITVWHEIHTAHTTREESEQEIKKHMEMWDSIWRDLCLVPLKVKKPEWECFPGSVGAVEYYSIMPSGKVMENGSCNNLGQAYAKKFNIKFKKPDGSEDYAWMTCTGNGARLLAAVIGVHGDNTGLILPPKIAPVQVVIIPIYNEENKGKILKYSKSILKKLEKTGFRVLLDDGPESVGSKFYEWEIKGVPLRIEIGMREVDENKICIVRRDSRKRRFSPAKNVVSVVKEELEKLSKNLLENSMKTYKEKIVEVKDLKQLKKELSAKNVAKVYWCGSPKCWDAIKEISEGVELFGTSLEDSKEKGKCVICGKETKQQGFVANTY